MVARQQHAISKARGKGMAPEAGPRHGAAGLRVTPERAAQPLPPPPPSRRHTTATAAAATATAVTAAAAATDSRVHRCPWHATPAALK